MWQQRASESFYPVIYLDALVIKVRDGAHVRNKAAHIAVGVAMDGIKHVQGIWVQATEGEKFWAGVCAQLANRGITDVLIVCCDGLTGFPEAIEARLHNYNHHRPHTGFEGPPSTRVHNVSGNYS